MQREASIVKVYLKISLKLKNKEIIYLFINYIDKYDRDCYIMWDSDTNEKYETRNVIWLKGMYFGSNLYSQSICD